MTQATHPLAVLVGAFLDILVASAMGFPLSVFVSSTCHELRDLRAAIKAWLAGLGLTPMMSDETGFPHVDGMPPYATCLRVLEECPLVVGVVDRQYGRPFDDWGPYSQHAGCAPTHAELRHALELGKRVLIYVHDDTWNFYEVWRKNPEAFKTAAPAGLSEATLKMFEELKLRSPAPWIEHFADASDVIRSLQAEFVNQLYTHLRDRERQTSDLASYLLEKVEEAAPAVREKIEADLTPALVSARDDLQQRLTMIEAELEKTRGASDEQLRALAAEKGALEARMGNVQAQVAQMRLMLAKAALKDVSWLDWVRRTMMPKQPGRIPFHNSAEVALRGYHALAGTQGKRPLLKEVTWSKLAYNEGGLHRGYRAGIILRGSDFVPGATVAHRRVGEGLPAGNKDYFWHLPNIYFGDYLELAASDDEIESPLSWRNYEYQVKNPEGLVSDWVTLSYPFDMDLLKRLQRENLERGEALLEGGKPAEAVEPLRKGYIFADRLFGVDDPETLRAKEIWHRGSDAAALSRLRFRVGDTLAVREGPHAGKEGIVDRLLLNHVHAYLIKPGAGEAFQASDQQVERLK
ncbi:MAG TPA: DUF4062 domain-containing protein [Polyangiaceae bacterium]|nr:DUF4062 domain-containing protein [Polyangiaceae bacterium]